MGRYSRHARLTAVVTHVTTAVNPHLVYFLNVQKTEFRELVVSTVVRLLRETREKRGFSMNVVAQRSGLSHSIVSLVERNLRNPTLDTLLRIAEAIEVDLGKMITQARKLATGQNSKRSKPTAY